MRKERGAENKWQNYKDQRCTDTAFVVVFKRSIEMLHMVILVAIRLIHHAMFDIIPLPHMKHLLRNLAQTDGAFQ